MYQYPKEWKDLKVSLTHDWLTGMRGGERVLQILADAFPESRIYTLFHNPDAIIEAINKHDITTSWLNGIPNITKNYRNFLPLFPSAVNTIKTLDTQLMISTSHCVAKSIQTSEETKHLCYCFTPMRYAWLFHEEYFGRNPIKNSVIKPTLGSLRKWDKATADRVNLFVGISEHVKQRIEDFYGRDALVVYPPVDTDFFKLKEDVKEEFDLVVSALVPYKKVDLAVEAYKESGRHLKVIGSGGAFEALKKKAPPNVEILGRLSDEEIREHYQQAGCLVFPGEEDFGIVPVEAMSCGTPVVAFAKGGALETVVDGESGVFFHEQTTGSLNEAVERCHQTDWDSSKIRTQAEKFSIQAFIDGIDGAIKECLR